jgi:hypothetical protein
MADLMHADNDPEAAVLRLGYVSFVKVSSYIFFSVTMLCSKLLFSFGLFSCNPS